MIAKLKGTIEFLRDNYAVVDVNGVGYKVFITTHTFGKIAGLPVGEAGKKEAEFYLDPLASKYNMMLTVKRNWMFVNAGIDESNANNQYILWPKDPQASVNKIWQFLRVHYGI